MSGSVFLSGGARLFLNEENRKQIANLGLRLTKLILRVIGLFGF